MPSVLRSGSLNLLEPSGPVQASNGISLPFYLSVAFINYIVSNRKLMNIMLEKDMADIGHGLVSSVILHMPGDTKKHPPAELETL